MASGLLTFVHRAALDACNVATLGACKAHACLLGIRAMLIATSAMHETWVVMACQIQRTVNQTDINVYEGVQQHCVRYVSSGTRLHHSI